MGTNYYVVADAKPPCQTCGHQEPAVHVHIGKSSGGWTFALHVMPEQGLNSLADWERLWAEPWSKIVDESGTVITPEAMRGEITARRGGGNQRFPGHFLDENEAEVGPHGLLRRRLRKPRNPGEYGVIGYGDGTYDLCAGEFS